MHRKERQMKSDECEPEIPLASSFAQHPSRDFREPIVDSPDQREYGAPNQDVVEMGDDEIRVVHLGVDWNGCHHDAGQAANDEGDDKADHKKERRAIHRSAVPERREPTEDLDPARNGNEHAGGGEQPCSELRKASDEHVVNPETEGEK